MIRASYDVIVIGAGSMGMSAGYYLARQGISTLMIDAFDPPHQQGSHHGEPRLIRYAYNGGSTYVRMALRARELWKELEETAGTSLMVQSGVLNMVDSRRYSLQDKLEAAQRYKIPVEMLGPEEMCRRWPGLVLPESYEGLYESEAGYLYSETCIKAYRRLALAEGAKLLTDTRVKQIEAGEHGLTVFTQDGAYYADRLILSAGAWFKTLEPFITLPVRSVRKVIGWFQTEGLQYDTGHFPGFTLSSPEGTYYGFPSIEGAGLKIGRHDTGVEWEPGEILEPFSHYEEDEGDLRRILEKFMPLAAGKLLRGSVCKYECTPDENFIMDHHPLYPNVVVAGGFSGHGFKFASAAGEILSDLAVRGHTDLDIDLFSLSRFTKKKQSTLESKEEESEWPIESR